MNIVGWLRELGLERYEEAFRENEVGLDVLPKLTAEDLKEIGVIPVGDRRRLLEAIAELAQEAKPKSDAADQPRKPTEAERRQLTVLFCDLVGSTELSAKLDPEDLRDVMRIYQDACAAVLKRWDGHVAKYLGDGVLAYFGWPKAHEDDAERAVRAGTELVAAVGQLTADGSALAARIGIATGQVVVGDLIGKGAALEEAVVGDTPNRAARLQVLAEPGTVVIAPSTRRLLGDLFELTDLGPQNLKGFPEPLSAWQVVAESGAESRFEALHPTGLTPLVGREHEIGLLMDRWARAKEGGGQVVLLSGEPGIGKSRLVRALRERLADQPHTPLSHYCSPYHTNSVLYPVIGLLERAAGFARDDLAEVRLDKLEALLARNTEALGEVVPLIAALLGIETGERYPPLALSPQRQKQRTLEVLVDQVERLAADQPVLAIYEDVHWMDPTTVEALDLLVERMQRLPVLVLITFRSEFDPPWTGHTYVTQLSLSRLTRQYGQALVAEVTGGKVLPDEVLDQIVARTDGVPLFVEELTKTVLESDLLTDAGERLELLAPLPALAIPSTLQDSLMARLDRFAVVKEVAQIGAVIGREFSHELLAAVSPLSEADLTAAFDQLVQTELIFRRGTPPDATYSFKHAMVQDVAYQSLLRAQRVQLHARIAQVLIKGCLAATETQPEVLAHHLTEAGLSEQAIKYWELAGRRAIERFANAEAIGHLASALKLFEALPEAERRDREELRLRIAIIVPLIAMHGFGSIEVERCAHRAKELSDRSGDTEHRFAAVRAVWNSSLLRRPVPKTIALSGELLRAAEVSRDPVQLAVAHRSRGYSLFIAGQFEESQGHLAQGIELADSVGDAARFGVYGEHPAMVCRTYAAQTLTILGAIGRATTLANEAIDVALRLANPHTLAWALTVAAHSALHRRDAETARVRSEAAIELAQDHRLLQWLALSTFFHGWALSEAGGWEAGIAEMEQGRARWRDTGAVLHTTLQLGLLATARCAAGDLEHGRADLRAAFAHLDGFSEHYVEAELHRIEALFQRREGTPATEVEAVLRRAIAIAEGQSARLWQLRASTDLARLWADQGKRQKAHDLLSPIYGWFTKGFDTADLKDAKALLDELQ